MRALIVVVNVPPHRLRCQRLGLLVSQSRPRMQSPRTYSTVTRVPLRVLAVRVTSRTRAAGIPAEPSELNTLAARVIMTVMYAARVARPDLLRAIAHLVRDLTTWSEDTDTRLHRLASYMQSPVALRMCAWQAPSFVDQPWVHRVSSDADYAECTETQRSTIGAIAVLSGKGTSVHLSFLPKRQGCVQIHAGG